MRKLVIVILGAAAVVIACAALWKPLYQSWKMHKLLNGTIEERRVTADYLSDKNVRYYAVDLERPPTMRNIDGVHKGFVEARMADLRFRIEDMGRESVQVWDEGTWKIYSDWGMNALPDHIAKNLEKEGKDTYNFIIRLGKRRKGLMTFRVRSFPK